MSEPMTVFEELKGHDPASAVRLLATRLDNTRAWVQAAERRIDALEHPSPPASEETAEALIDCKALATRTTETIENIKNLDSDDRCSVLTLLIKNFEHVQQNALSALQNKLREAEAELTALRAEHLRLSSWTHDVIHTTTDLELNLASMTRQRDDWKRECEKYVKTTDDLRKELAQIKAEKSNGG